MIKNLKIKNYRSFGGEGVSIKGLKKINIFIGKNNCGKSNILKFLDFLSSNESINHNKRLIERLEIEDYFDRDKKNTPEFTIGFNSWLTVNNSLENNLLGTIKSARPYVSLTYKILPEKTELEKNSYILRNKNIDDQVRSDVEHFIKQPNWGHLFAVPISELLKEFRELENNKELIKKIDELYRATPDEHEEIEKFNLLQDFVSSIFGFSVKIQVNKENKIQLIFNEEKKPRLLSSLGSGLHEIIILGFFLMTIKEPSIVSIDEPELHLHPGLQRIFLKYITENTNHQYFIATHSNTFLDFDAKDKTIFRVKLDNRVTVIEKCSGLQETTKILDDLGIRASEILQTNGIIWVEGPSDRIYIKKWLELAGCDFKEGLDYSFQYYGGKMLSKYSIKDSEFEKFINMLFINRNCFVVMDSDMSVEYNINDLRDTKKRLIEECESNKIDYWVTAGREIENYLSSKVSTKFSGTEIKRKKFKKIKEFCPKYKIKVRDSRKIIALMNNKELIKNLDLEEQINKLKENIKKWND